MTFGNYGINLETVEVTEYTNLGEGKYPMVITSHEEKKADDGSRVYFMVEYTIFEGANKDQKHNEFFDVVNTGKPVVAEIGIGNIKKLAIACGKPNAASFDELMNIPFIATRKKKGEYTNTVAYDPYVAGAVNSAPVAAAGGDAPAWANKG